MLIKIIHLICATLSLAGFLLRGAWMWRESPWLSRRATRVLPHVIDTALFLSGLIMVLAWHGGSPQPWLAAKLAAVVIYIVCGMVALHGRCPRPLRMAAFIAALLVFAWIVSVARSRSIVFPLHWIAGP